MSRNERTARANLETWKRSNAYELWHVYGSFSRAKAQAWEYCKELCYKFGGYGLKIISYNTFIFTAGFEFVDPETGVVKFMYITPNYDTVIDQ